MGQIEERNRMDIIGFLPQDLRMTAGGDVFLCWPLFFLFSLDNIIEVAKIYISIRYKYKRGKLYDFFSKGHDPAEK